jgi:hypothetical protein
MSEVARHLKFNQWMRLQLDGTMIEEFFAKCTSPISMRRNDHDDATEIDR